MNETKQLLQWLNDKAYRLKNVGDYEGFECYRRYYLALQAIYYKRQHSCQEEAQ